MAKFAKGTSGNPRGRPPKGQSITEMIRSKLDRDRFVSTLLTLAYGGDLTAIKLVLNYVDGLPTQVIEQQGDLRISVEYQDLELDNDDDDADLASTA